MTVPTCGITHDVVIYDGWGKIGPIGLIVKPYSYRVTEAPGLVPRMSVGDPKGTDHLGYTSWVQEDFRGGRGQVRATMPANNRYAGGRGLLPEREEGFLGVHATPQVDSIRQIDVITDTVSYPGLNTIYAHKQRRWWYLPGINWGADNFCDMIIAWRGAWQRRGGSGHQPTDQIAQWGSATGGLSTIDACRYSTCAVVALQGSWGGYIKPVAIRVLWHSAWATLPVSTTYTGGAGAAAVTTYDGKLWKADWEEPRIAWYDIQSVNDSIEPTWSNYVRVGTTGPIQKMTPFMGRLFIAKSNGIWAYEAGRTYQVIDLTERAAKWPFTHDDFSIFLEAHGALYWNIGNKLMRYTSGGLLEELAGHLDSAPVAASPVRRGLAIITAHRLWILDTHMGGLYWVCQSPRHPLHMVGTHAGNLWIAPHQYSWWDMPGLATFTRGDHLMMAGEPQFEARNNSFHRGSTEQYIVTSFVDLGRPGMIKAWRRVVVRYQGIVSSSWPSMNVFYRRDPEGKELTGLGTPKLSGAGEQKPPIEGFAWLGTLNAASKNSIAKDKGVAVFSFGNTVRSRAIKVMVALTTGSVFKATEARPAIFGIEVEGEAVRTTGRDMRRKQYNFSAIVTDNMELLDMEVENSAAHVIAALYSLSGTGATHVVALPFPPPVGHTTRARVQLGATGAVVPILPSSYSDCPSGCPGAEVALTITEV